MQSHHKLSGADIIIESLKQESVDTIFGYPGGVVLPIYDRLYDETAIEHILVRHEQGAVHMAEGYAKASGKIGVVLVTSGPGATNTITGITDALMDSIPLVIISGQVPSSSIGLDAFQEADVIGITRPITKWNYLVRHVSELAEVLFKAFRIAESGRPGPVLVDIPKDVLLAETTFLYPKKIQQQPSKKILKSEINQFIQALRKSTKPLFYIGGGVIAANAAEKLKQFVKKTNIPLTHTLHGIGAFPAQDSQCIGMLGMHGAYAANRAIDDCDCLIALGARFDDRVTGKTDLFSLNSFKIQVDIDQSNANKSIDVDLFIQADLLLFLSELNNTKWEDDGFSDWWKAIEKWQIECSDDQNLDFERLHPQQILQSWSKKTNGEFLVVTDVGQNQMWTAQTYKFAYPRHHISSGGLGTMGFSLPAAIGASLAKKRKQVISINGDGGFQMNMQEMITARYYKIPLIIIILNNESLGMVRQWQDLFHEKRFSFTDLSDSNPDFIALANAMGIEAQQVNEISEVETSIDWALTFKNAPCLIEYRITKEEMVFPMVPAGKSVKDMILKRLITEMED